MICPLLHPDGENTEEGIQAMPKDCLKEECAWWLDDINMCAIRDLALELRYAQLRLADLKEEMPHEGQFRK